MRPMRRDVCVLAVVAVAISTVVALAVAIPVAAESIFNPEPVDVVAGPGGSMWVSNSEEDSISRITPSGEIITYRDPAIESPTDLVVGGAGVAVWFVGHEQIGRVGLEAKVVVHPLPGLLPTDIARGADGRMWVTAGGGAGPAIARVNGGGRAELFRTGVTSRPTAITGGPDGRLWFIMPTTQQIAAIDTSGVVTVMATGVTAVDITTGPDGNLWFTNRSVQNPVGRLTPQGQLTLFPTTGLPYSPTAISVGLDGNLWFTVWSGALGRVTPAGTYTFFSVPSPDTGIGEDADLLGIAAGPDGNVWFTNRGAGAVGRLDPSSGDVTYFGPRPTITSFPISGAADLVAGPDGSLWYASTGGIGRLTPGGDNTLFELPDGRRASDITVGADDALWFVSRNGAFADPAIGRITTAGEITEFAGDVGNPSELTKGADGNVWFVHGTVTLGRITPAGEIAVVTVCTDPERLFGLAAGSDGQIWWVCTEVDSFDELPDSTLGSIGPSGEIHRFTTVLGTGELETGPDGRLWSSSSAFENVQLQAFPPDDPGARDYFFSFDLRFDYPRRLAAGSDGNLWFIVTDAIGTVSPDGRVGLFTIPGVRTVASGPDGHIWFSTGTSIGRLTVPS